MEKAAEEVSKVAMLLLHAPKLVVFTGAGMSGHVLTFRGKNGIWTGISGLLWKFFATPIGWNWFPQIGWRKYLQEFYGPLAKAGPNEGHKALAEIESKRRMIIVTMNVDGYHQAAGSSTCYELHGTIKRHRCVKNGHPMDIPEEQLLPDTNEPVPRCNLCGSTPRPDCVLFMEALPEQDWAQAYQACSSLGKGDVILVIGTSSQVYPAASLPEMASENGATVIEINLEKTRFTQTYTDIFLQGSCEEILQKLSNVIEQAAANS